MNLAGPWPARLLWLLLPLGVGPAFAGALDETSRVVALVLEVAAWLVWTIGVVAVLVPRTMGLTFLRVAAPAALALAGWAAAEVATWTAALAVATATATAVAALAPTTGDAFVNGSAYGAERRFALRPPAVLLLGPIVAVWALVVAGVASGPLLLAAEQWVTGVLATVVGIPVAALGSRSLHQLARRWLVFVPAGLVVHDPTAVAPRLIQRAEVRGIAPAPATTTAHDLTAGAAGLALQIDLAGPIEVEAVRRRGAAPSPVTTDQLLIAPTRPGAVLREAVDRRLPVG